MAYGGRPNLPGDYFLNRRMTDSELNHYIDMKLQPDDVFISRCNIDVDMLATFLKQQWRGHSVRKTEKGGSLKKGTAIKMKADLDLVVFLNDYRDMASFVGNLPNTLEDLERQIRRMSNSQFQVESSTKHALKLRIRSRENADFLDVDVLPAFDCLQNGASQVYSQMSVAEPYIRQYYSVCLEPLQSDFVFGKIGNRQNVKNLIRLTKYWRKTYFEERSDSRRSLPTSYFFELLVISLWEKAGSPASFSVTKAFKNVMQTLQHCGQIDITFPNNGNYSYNFRGMETKKPNEPFLLDPANPFNNICTRARAWDEVSDKARVSLACPLLQSVQNSPNSWM